MNYHIRYLGRALAEWEHRGIPPSSISSAVDLLAAHVGDLITHPDFPDEWLVIRARHIDLDEPALTLYLDLLHEHPLSGELPYNVKPLRP